MSPNSNEAVERKLRSESLLKNQGVRINGHLPVIETEAEAHLRNKEEIAYRTLALLVAALKAEGLERSITEKIVEKYGLASHFTPNESAFLQNTVPSENDRVQFIWRYESAWVLLWAIGYVEELGNASKICNVPMAVTIMKERTTEQFLGGAQLRSADQILDEADLIYRYHWAVVDARLNGRPTPPGLDPDIVQERHYALNWLVGYMHQDWDDISTDT